MSHILKFEEDALAEWKNLDKSVRDPLKKKLSMRQDLEAYFAAEGRLNP